MSRPASGVQAGGRGSSRIGGGGSAGSQNRIGAGSQRGDGQVQPQDGEALHAN